MGNVTTKMTHGRPEVSNELTQDAQRTPVAVNRLVMPDYQPKFGVMLYFNNPRWATREGARIEHSEKFNAEQDAKLFKRLYPVDIRVEEIPPPDDWVCDHCGDTFVESGHIITEDTPINVTDSRWEKLGEMECNNCGCQQWHNAQGEARREGRRPRLEPFPPLPRPSC